MVRDGLKAGEQVMVDGFQKVGMLPPGTPVKAVPWTPQGAVPAGNAPAPGAAAVPAAEAKPADAPAAAASAPAAK